MTATNRRWIHHHQHEPRPGDPTKTHPQPVIHLDDALDLVHFAINHGQQLGVRCSVSVVGPAMDLIAFGKADGATPHSVDSSRRKANTAASTRRDTGWMPESLALPLPLATDLQMTNITGGSPLISAGTTPGGIGIAGGTPDQDAQIAAATVEHAVTL